MGKLSREVDIGDPYSCISTYTRKCRWQEDSPDIDSSKGRIEQPTRALG